VKCNAIIRTAMGAYSLMADFHIISLSYANQTDNQKHKTTCSSDLYTLLMTVYVVFSLN